MVDDVDIVLLNRLSRLDADLKQVVDEACANGFDESGIPDLKKRLQQVLDACVPCVMRADVEIDNDGLPIVRIMPSHVDPEHAREVASQIRNSRRR